MSFWPVGCGVAALLDEAIQRLRGKDRDAIVLRYFERRDLHGVGTALGVSEEAARKRVSRALERLRVFFNRRGLNFSASTLAALLATHAVTAAPTGMVVSISGAAIASVAVSGGTALTLLKIMTMTKLKLGYSLSANLADWRRESCPS